MEYARRMGCTAVCCGHTHAPVVNKAGEVAYYNSGCWTELPCHYLTVRDGVVSLHAFIDAIEVPVAEAENVAVAMVS